MRKSQKIPGRKSSGGVTLLAWGRISRASSVKWRGQSTLMRFCRVFIRLDSGGDTVKVKSNNSNIRQARGRDRYYFQEFRRKGLTVAENIFGEKPNRFGVITGRFIKRPRSCTI